MEESKYKFKPKQLFPINTNITTALTLQGEILTVTSTYPPTLTLFNTETYNMIFSRQLDYEIRKIEKIRDKLILLSDNYLEFHNMSRFIEKVQTKAVDFKYNPRDGRIYSVGNKGIEIIDFTKNIKLSNPNFNKNDQLSKIQIHKLGYVINNRKKAVNNLRNSIDIYDFRINLPNKVTSKSTESIINSLAIKDSVRFYSLSEKEITEHDLRSSSVIKYSLNQKGVRNLKCIKGGLMFNNEEGVFYLNESFLTSNKAVNISESFRNESYKNKEENKEAVNILAVNEEVEDYILKDGYLYLGGSNGVQIFHNEYFSLSG